MTKILSIALLITVACSNTAVFCQYANLEFTENKGQWDPAVKFKGDLNNGAFFLLEKGFRVLQSKSEDLQKLGDYYHGISHTEQASTLSKAVVPGKDKIIVRSHAYDVQFVNASVPVISGDKVIKAYNNYIIGNDPSKWKGNCRIFHAINYKNIYKGVDARYYTSEGQLKYDLIVHPGADVTKIAIKYEGVEGLTVKNGQLVITTSVGETRELAPYTYQVVNGQKKEVACRYKVSGNTVTFIVDDYVKSSTLVIDPTLIFSSFTGSPTDNWGYTATYGPDGSFYAGGIVFGNSFPTSPGAFQAAFGGGGADEENLPGYDIGIMKFSPDGVSRMYSTYLGGSGNEQPHSLVVDNQNSLIVAGRTNSTNYPTKSDNYGDCGGYDIILTKLNASGTDLIGSRKIGGTGRDGVNIRPKYSQPSGVESIRRNYGDDARSEVIIDNEGNILLASNSQSDKFPVTAGVFQKASGGKQDAVVIKLSSDLRNVIFSTLLGGKENDAAFVLAINPTDNNIYIGGNTVSADLPGSKTGVLNATYQGGQADGFVSIIRKDGSAILKTSYFGTSGHDMVYGIQFDKFGYPYIMGTTTGVWPMINARFSQEGGKQYISKLRPDLSGYEYSTVFGTKQMTPNISPIAFLVDRCENVYVSGWGGSVNTRAGFPSAGTVGLTTTPDAIQPNTDNSDFYFFVLERDASRQLYGSFFGQNGGFGEHVDGGTSRFDRNGVIYQALCANCGRDIPFPTTPGVWAPVNGSHECNLAAVKIAFNLAGVAGSVRASVKGVINDTSGCVPLTVDFADTIAAGKRYIWNFGDGSADIETTTAVLSHTYTVVGDYRVMLVSIDSSKCNVADTAYTNIKVRTYQVDLGFTAKKQQPCTAFNYEFANTSTVSPSGRSFTNNSFTWHFGDNTPPVTAGTNLVTHSFPGPGVYKVKLVLTDTMFCNAPDSLEITLRIATNVDAQFVTPAKGCAPYNAFFENTSAGGERFYWDFGDGTTSTEVSPEHLYDVPGTYLVKLTAIDSATCNITDSTSFTIVVSDQPIASFTFSPDPPQENTPVEFFNTTTGAVRYLWRFGDGDTLLTNSLASVKHTYNATGLFSACLIAFNNNGCPDTVCHDVQARIVPLLDVPNAFTPNGDGINDQVFVRGFGIMRMSWRIYNRWGALVFETATRKQGWDGTFKGSPLPGEVYHYVLDVEYSDNTTFQKKGDITLLR